MPEYLSPGVYIEEVSTGPRPIEGVSTSNAGFVGQAERGPTTPRLVTSWVNYNQWFGGYIDPAISYMPHAVKGFFDNGGKRAFVARIHPDDSVQASLDLGGFVINAYGAGAWGNRVFVRVGEPSRRDPANPGQPDPNRFRLTVIYYSEPYDAAALDPFDVDNLGDPNRRDPDVFEDFDDLGVDPQGTNYVVTMVNNASKLITLPEDAPPPQPAAAAAFAPLANGADNGDNGRAGLQDYLGDPAVVDSALQTGLSGLNVIDDVNMVIVPDAAHDSLDDAVKSELINASIRQCENLRDRFAILDMGLHDDNFAQMTPPADSKYAAVYYPWVRIYDPRIEDTYLVPPSGHVAGIYARTDIERGVHKAPANEVVRGIVNRDLNGSKKPLRYQITKGQHDLLNPRGINVIRDFRPDGRGIRVWGARTISSDPEWRYVNVRRLFIFAEESIEEGTQWVVFEPNYEATWAKVRRSITNFLIRVWRSGALVGTTPEEAFFVKCDETTMTQDDIDNGRLICYIGLAPVKPAEFVIFRLSQKTAEAQS